MTIFIKHSALAMNEAPFSEPHSGMSRERLCVAESYINEDPATSRNRTFHISMASLSALFFLTAILCIALFRYTLTAGGLAALSAELLPVVLFAGYCRLRGDRKIFRARLLLFWTAIMLCLSALATGWHYISGVLVGVALAVLSLAAAKAYGRYEDWPGCRGRGPESHPQKEAPKNEVWRRRSQRDARGLPALAKRRDLWSRTEAQSLIEVALFVPVFTLLICYSVDFGYCFLAATTIDAVSQNAIDYAIQGTKSPSQSSEPSGSLVAAFVAAALGLPNASSSTSVQVCSNSIGTPQNNVAQCQTFGADASLSYTADTDPESPTFQLNRVDVVYTLSPPIPLPTSILPSLTFHRSVEMRAIQ